MRGEERKGEESLPGALVCDSPQAPRPSLPALARQADESHQRRRFEAILHLHCISVTHGSTGRLIPGGRSQRRSNYKVAVTLDQLVTLTMNSGVYFEGIGGLESPENESVGHSQTRPESGRISGMKVTQASPQDKKKEQIHNQNH